MIKKILLVSHNCEILSHNCDLVSVNSDLLLSHHFEEKKNNLHKK